MMSDRPFTLLTSVARRRFLVSVWPWRGLAYGGTTALVTGALWVCLAGLLAPVLLAVVAMLHGHLLAAVPLGLLGIAFLAALGPPLSVALGYVERRRLRLADDRPTCDRSGRAGSRRDLYREPGTWQAFAYLFVLALVTPLWLGAIGLAGLLSFALLVTPLAVRTSGRIMVGGATVHSMGAASLLMLAGLASLPVLAYLIAVFGGAQAALARALLSTEETRLVEVARSRARLVDAFDAERHRIERDLHDGAQQRLVSLTMQLGLAGLDLPAGSPAASAVGSAHEQAKELMVELRDLVRGINPRTLTELGLAVALDELAAAGPVPVVVRADVGRFPAPVETVAYFAVSEALTNVAKHSGAAHASITAVREGGTLVVEVRDDGHGGADPAYGSGLTGLADRVAAAGGRLLLSSPTGGPTLVRVEVPCAS